uniref:Uncharacterized protein n=1 Tax=Plectus sambesii TaxID=2011161 RepID=A0A914WK35_9BILA
MHSLPFFATVIAIVVGRPQFNFNDHKMLTEIPCPSGGKMYVDPMTSDIEMCTQHFGFYANTCPNGTRCERLANRNLLFKDFCCWPPDEPEKPLVVEEQTTTKEPEEPTTTASITEEGEEEVEGKGGEEGEGEEGGKGGEEVGGEGGGEGEVEEKEEVEATTVAASEEEIDSIAELVAKRFKGPRCKDQEDKVLIDLGARIGDRIPDCSYSPCPKGYSCEYNNDVRQFICCGTPPDELPAVGFPLEPVPRIRVIEPPMPNVEGITKTKKPPSRKWKHCPEGRALMYFEEAYPVVCEQKGTLMKGSCPNSHSACLPSKEHEHKVCCDVRNLRDSQDTSTLMMPEK